MLDYYTFSLKTENMTNFTPYQLKNILHKALGSLKAFEQCALLDYPNYPNIGDHLIWLGEVFYLTDVLKAKINYATSADNFSEIQMEKRIGKSPILLQGGGNLGDIWDKHQNFREYIISRYQDRQIIILPQTIYFADPSNLIKTATIFNAHPNLTLFVRDNYSYEIALQYFRNCQVFNVPDMAFQMAGMPGLSFNYHRKHPILYHCRDDKEYNPLFSPKSINIPNLVIEDWNFQKNNMRDSKNFDSKWKGFQEETTITTEWISRQIWKCFHPYSSKFYNFYDPFLHLRSWMYMHRGIYQFHQYRLIITNRLHGHILCVLMGIPHIFLPNSYHKNEAFYNTWTYSIPFCKFVKDSSKIKIVAEELLNFSSELN